MEHALANSLNNIQLHCLCSLLLITRFRIDYIILEQSISLKTMKYIFSYYIEKIIPGEIVQFIQLKQTWAEFYSNR